MKTLNTLACIGVMGIVFVCVKITTAVCKVIYTSNKKESE